MISFFSSFWGYHLERSGDHFSFFLLNLLFHRQKMKILYTFVPRYILGIHFQFGIGIGIMT